MTTEEGSATQALCQQYILMKRGFSSNFKAWLPLIRGLTSTIEAAAFDETVAWAACETQTYFRSSTRRERSDDRNYVCGSQAFAYVAGSLFGYVRSL